MQKKSWSVGLSAVMVLSAVACGTGSTGAADDKAGPGGETGSGGSDSGSGGKKSQPSGGQDAGTNLGGQGGDGLEPGGSGGTTEATGGKSSAEPTTPKVVETLPAEDATGVLPSTAIRIEFSERMDPDSVLEAYRSIDLPPDSVTFEWNKAGTILTLVPNAELDVATGSDPATTEAITYTITLGTGAQSAAGVSLADSLALHFSTARRFEQSIAAVPKMTGAVLSNLTTLGIVGAGDSNIPTEVGYAYYVGAVTFDLDELPTDVIAFSEVRLNATHAISNGAPYSDLGGPLGIYDVEYEVLTFSEVALYLGEPFATRSNAAAEVLSATVTDQVTADYDAERFAQFAFRFPDNGDDDGEYDTLALLEPTLALQYYVP